MAVRVLLVCYCGTFLLSAALLFSVQPMIAKIVLPLYGGSPAVWTTCMVFFQAALLAGYGYAYAASVWLPVRRQLMVHCLVVALPLLALPIGAPEEWTPATTSNPTPSLLLLLVMAVGSPFLVVSTTAPLLQRWFAETDHPSAHDPYFLYAVSNAGSMAALLGYPVVIEPTLRLQQQVTWWSVGYIALVALIAVCAMLTWRLPRDLQHEQSTRGAKPRGQKPARGDVSLTRALLLWERENGGKCGRGTRVANVDRAWWIVLAFVPSSWMLGVTVRITTDITPFPLLWIIPLSLYLLTFILVFSRRQLLPHTWMLRLFPFAMVLLAVSLIVSRHWQLFALHLLAYFVGAMVCHGELARRRPGRQHLTQFYLWMSVGGVLGGVFNAIVAPLAFPTLLELPLVVALSGALHPGRDRMANPKFDLAALVITTVLIALLIHGYQVAPSPTLVAVVLAATPLLVVLYFVGQPRWFAVVLAAVLVWDSFDVGPKYRVLERRRSFFGVHLVLQDIERVDKTTGETLPTFRRLRHGTTDHGIQHVDSARACEPMAYFHRAGPLGDVLDVFRPQQGQVQQVAVIGLGSGAMACYASPQRFFTFYEIDPVVQQLAETPEYFTYLSDCGRGRYRVIIGDGRLSIVKSDRVYSVFVLDAFSSDAIPTHLLTREALEMYQQKLTSDGILVFHISNLHLDLVTVLADLAPELGIVGLVCRDAHVSFEEQEHGRAASTWVVLAREKQHLWELSTRSRWRPLPRRKDRTPWTDDFSNIFSILRWNPEDVLRGTMD